MKDQIKKKDYFYALLLESSTIEDFLRSLIYLNASGLDGPSKKLKNSVDQMSFYNLLIFNRVIRVIDDTTYSKLDSFREKRNVYVHQLTGYNFDDPNTNKKLSRVVSFGQELCQELFDIQDKAIDSIAFDLLYS